MRELILAGALAAGPIGPSVAHADITVTFRDGAPKDRITIINSTECATGPIAVTLDLMSAPAGLIFDVTGAGAGVEVFQPVEVVTGETLVEGVSKVIDGDQILTVTMRDMGAGDEVAVTVDLDDTAGGREITVNGSEIAGAMILVTTDIAVSESVFDDSGQARVRLASCTS